MKNSTPPPILNVFFFTCQPPHSPSLSNPHSLSCTQLSLSVSLFLTFVCELTNLTLTCLKFAVSKGAIFSVSPAIFTHIVFAASPHRSNAHPFTQLSLSVLSTQVFYKIDFLKSTARPLNPTRTLFQAALSFALNRPPSSFQPNPHPLSRRSLFQH